MKLRRIRRIGKLQLKIVPFVAQEVMGINLRRCSSFLVLLRFGEPARGVRAQALHNLDIVLVVHAWENVLVVLLKEDAHLGRRGSTRKTTSSPPCAGPKLPSTC